MSTNDEKGPRERPCRHKRDALADCGLSSHSPFLDSLLWRRRATAECRSQKSRIARENRTISSSHSGEQTVKSHQKKLRDELRGCRDQPRNALQRGGHFRGDRRQRDFPPDPLSSILGILLAQLFLRH
jgi:hypothetical protein